MSGVLAGQNNLGRALLRLRRPNAHLRLNGYKGVDLAWGLTALGATSYDDWLMSDGAALRNYNEPRVNDTFTFIQTVLGVNNVLIWLWLDGLWNKAVGWGTGAWLPAYNANLANWQSFLTNVVIPKRMKLICVLFNSSAPLTASHGYDTTHTIPTPAAPYKMDAVTAHGNLDVDLFNAVTDWWATGGPGFTATWQANSGGAQPLGSGREIRIDTAATIVDLRPPLVPVNRSAPKLYISVDIRGGAGAEQFTPVLNYYDSADVLLKSNLLTQTAIVGVGWTNYQYGTSLARMPQGTAKVALVIRCFSGFGSGIIYIGGMRVAPGVNSPLTTDYLSGVKSFVGMNNEMSPYGPAIGGWVIQNEGNVGLPRPAIEVRDFYAQCYQAIRQVSQTQPVGVDCFNSGSANPFTAGNEDFYLGASDFKSYHSYTAGGVFPNLTTVIAPEQEIMVTELGETLANLYDDVLNPLAVNAGMTQAYQQGAKGVFPWSLTLGNIALSAAPNTGTPKVMPLQIGPTGVVMAAWVPPP